MKFGVCIGNEIGKIRLAAEYGFDYVETGFGFFCNSTDEELDEFCRCLEENNIKAESANGFLPGTLKVTGDEIDYDALKAYIEKGMSRGLKAGLKTVVFGSGGARSFPENYPYEKAVRQLVCFLAKTVAPLAEKYGITVVVEPLRRFESNIINSVKEGCILAAAAGSDNIKGLSDSFHMCSFSDSFENIRDVKGFIGHAHIAEPSKRVYPYANDGADYETYIHNLIYAGCPRCSIEAKCEDFEKEAPEALGILKKAAE